MRRTSEGIRADILVVLRDFGPLIPSHLSLKAVLSSQGTWSHVDWLQMNGYVRCFSAGNHSYYDITDSGCQLIKRLSDKHREAVFTNNRGPDVKDFLLSFIGEDEFYSSGLLANEIGCTSKTIVRHARALEKKGLLSCKRVCGNGGQTTLISRVVS